MKAVSLLLLRISTGLLLIVWGAVRLCMPDMGAKISDKYYGGIGSISAIQTVWGIALTMIGLLCILGLFRRFAYPAQALVLISGALAIWRYLLDPLGLFLFEEGAGQILFFPSLGMAAATIVLWAFRGDDTLALDVKLRKN